MNDFLSKAFNDIDLIKEIPNTLLNYNTKFYKKGTNPILSITPAINSAFGYFFFNSHQLCRLLPIQVLAKD